MVSSETSDRHQMSLTSKIAEILNHLSDFLASEPGKSGFIDRVEIGVLVRDYTAESV